ncbi:serine/threonine-protein kinase pim-1-like [Megalobrama amblycephala]|nr:serine/threonine-protein kinase pim-1-like [Megalobrama amblycephala]
MLEWFEEEDQYILILILEYSESCRDLYGFILQEKLSESQARSLMYQAVLAAKHCLDGGVFHRDIKLDNYVINTATNRVQLIDFGCGEVAESGIKGQFIGFACPPEYFADFEYEAEPTTVWSLGIMMHRTVCSCNPLRKEDGRLSFDSRVSAEFQELITWCLALNPSERATMEDILQHEWFRQERMSGAI